MRDVKPPDLEMQVRIASEHGKTWLVYTLHSPTGRVDFAHHVVVGPSFRGSPEGFQGHLLKKVEQLGHRVDVDGSLLLPPDIDRKLVSLGRDLWQELFPTEIRHAYREIRRSVHTWMIVSDEPWIPWELVKPYDASRPDEVLDDDFLPIRFELTRWLAGNKPAAQQIAVRSLAVFRTATDLPHAAQERDVLVKICQSRPDLVDATPAIRSAGEILKFLESAKVELLHFIGHGTHTAEQPEESGIPFPNRSVLRPGDLGGPLATHISQTRPLVFLNACWAGQQGWSLTRLGGWASRWVGICGCGAFIAPLWPTRDKAAFIFARTFYNALAGGATLGQAALKARRHVAQERPGDPSALVYTVYGHPNAHVGFGGESFAVEDVADGQASKDSQEPPDFKDESPLREPRTGGWLSVRAHRRWITAVTCAGLFVALALLGGRFAGIPNWLGSQHQGSATAAQTPIEPATSPRVPPAETAPQGSKRKPSVRSVSQPATAPPTGGNPFEIVAAAGAPKSALEEALRNAAGQEIKGWVLHIDLEAPVITPHTQDEQPMVMCSLTAHCRARQGSTSLDLSTVRVNNSQFNQQEACEGAAESLAKTIIYRLMTRKETT